jgi:hypothetical protein
MPTSNINCNTFSYDNRETCGSIIPSGCIGYTGYISTTIADSLPCRPNINDIVKKLQELVDQINVTIGDNSTLENCLGIDSENFVQSDFNEAVAAEICALKALLTGVDADIDPNSIKLAVDLLCLLDPTCTPQVTYTLVEVINKLVTKVCNLETRLTTVETYLNI